METPFLTPVENKQDTRSQELFLITELNPLLDPVQMGEGPESFQVDLYTADSETGVMPAINESMAQEELPADVLNNARALNPAYMISLKWASHLDEIISFLYKSTGINSRIPFTGTVYYDFLYNAIDMYQRSKGLNATDRGVMGLGTWSEMQKDLGYIKIIQRPFDINKAIEQNKYFEKHLWGSFKNFITRYFVEAKILKHDLPLDTKYFSYAIAAWQGSQDRFIKHPDQVDGILGKDSWDDLRTLIEGKFPEYEVRAHLKTTGELARRYAELMTRLQNELVQKYEYIKQRLQEKVTGNESDSRPGYFYDVLQTALSIVGVIPGPAGLAAKSVLALGAISVVKRFFDERSAAADASVRISEREYLIRIFEQLKDKAWFTGDAETIGHGWDDQMRSIKKEYEKNSKQQKLKVDEELKRLQQYIIDLEIKVKEPNAVMQAALASVIGKFSKNTRIIVDAENVETPIDNWTENDVRIVSERQKLKIQFSRAHPKVNVSLKEFDLSSLDRKILYASWSLWQEHGFALKNLPVARHILFRVNFFTPFPPLNPQAYDVYIRMMEWNETYWNTYDRIAGSDGNNIVFQKDGKQILKRLADRNSKGIAYGAMILHVVNSVMGNQFNNSSVSKNIPGVQYENIDSEQPHTDSLPLSEHDEHENNHNDYESIHSEITHTEEDIAGTEESETENEFLDMSSILKTVSTKSFKRTPAAQSFLSKELNLAATTHNQAQVSKSGISPTDIFYSLSIYFDTRHIESELVKLNAAGGALFKIRAAGESVIDSVFTETLHQFQVLFYREAKHHNGKIDASVLETLGFLKNNLRSSTSHLSGYSDVLKGLASEIESTTEYKSSEWYNHIIQPAWLGIKLASGVHTILYNKLKEAQDWLLSQPQYQGLNPVSLGKQLGVGDVTGARPMKKSQAMHAYGLAIDIDSSKNPWIGAGWISCKPWKTEALIKACELRNSSKLSERTRMLDVFRRISGQNLSGRNVFAYLDNIAQTNGSDTSAAYQILRGHNDNFIDLLSRDRDELSFWRASATFAHGRAAGGFLSLHADLVFALRHVAGLAWGAIDFGPNASGDIMHFDFRTIGIGKTICKKIGGHVPAEGRHPALSKEVDEQEYHEADEALLNDNENSFDETESTTEEAGSMILNEEEITSIDLNKAIAMNKHYGQQLGWIQFYDQINVKLLPLSGLQNVSLGEEDFARALSLWQKRQGFASTDCDGILGPMTWRVMQSMIVTGTAPAPSVTVLSSAPPPLSDIPGFNKWYAQSILDSMNAGIIGQKFESKSQLEKIARGVQVLEVDPNQKIIQALPIIHHITEQARINNYREIVIGSFIRPPSGGKCTGHCEGRCIDINHLLGNFESPDSVQMVINILNYLTSLPPMFKKNFGFGLPLQGDFFGRKNLKKFKSVPVSNINNAELKSLIPKLGIVFPDNDNHLHIQMKWMTGNIQHETDQWKMEI